MNYHVIYQKGISLLNIYITILLAVLLIVLLLFIAFKLLIFFMKKKAMSKTKDDIIKFMVNNSKMWSMSLIRNDHEIINHNQDKMMPLASTVKILYAIAFVNAVSNKSLNPDELIPIKEVDSLYLKNTDGNAHNAWKENEHIGNEVLLKEIAKGMMKYSSNACTEYMYYRLGKDKIDEVIRDYSLLQHTEIYPINAAILISSYLHIEKKIPKKEIAKTIREMTNHQYNLLATELLNKMMKGEANRLIEQLLIISDMNIQREITKKLPASSSFNYARLMYELGTTERITVEAKQLLDDLMGVERYLKDGIRVWYKGGSTLFVSTSAVYKKDDSENIAFAFFIEDMIGVENIWIQKNYNEFIKAFLDNHLFRTKALDAIDEMNADKG